MKHSVHRWFLMIGIVLLPAISTAAQAPTTGGLRIISPTDGSVIEPGQPFTVIVQPEPGVSPTAVALLSPSIFTFKEQPSFTYVVTIPLDAALGPERLVADGVDARQRSLRAEITVHVETATPVQTVGVISRTVGRSASVTLIRGVMEERLRVEGVFTDGMTRDISKSREISYSSSNPQVAAVTPDGLVKAVGEGTATITVTYKDKSATVPVKVEFERQSIKIDIRPGDSNNRVNLDSRGVVPVAILTTNTFDATRVDPLSVRFGPNGAPAEHGRGHFEDVDGDGFADMVLHFRQPETGIQCLQKTATLTGSTIDGVLIKGTDFIRPRGHNCMELPRR